MKLALLLAFALITIASPAIAQRYNAAPQLVKLGDTIRTHDIEAAKRLCSHYGGTHLIAHPNGGWDCFKLEPKQ
jgi:hypothetical protein